MPEISAQVVRFVSPLIIFLTLCLLADADLINLVPKGALAAFGGFVALLLGIFLHYVYHLIYPYTFTRVQDLLFKDTYRTYLQKTYNVSQPQSIRVFRKLRSSNFFRGEKESIYTDLMKIESAFIHALYFLTSTGLAFFVVSLFTVTTAEFYVFLALALISFSVGTLLDRRYETEEYEAVKSIPFATVKDVAAAIARDAQQGAAPERS